MEENLRLPKSTIHTVITTEIKEILGTIIFRTRLAKGWNPYDRKTQDFAIQTWFEILQTEKVPLQFFDELYRRACNFQAFQIRSGKEMPEMSAQLMLSFWNDLQKEIRQKEIEARNRLPETAQSRCPRCFGNGIELIYSADGARLGARPNCEHKKLAPGEWLFEKAKSDAEKAEKYKILVEQGS